MRATSAVGWQLANFFKYSSDCNDGDGTEEKEYSPKTTHFVDVPRGFDVPIVFFFNYVVQVGIWYLSSFRTIAGRRRCSHTHTHTQRSSLYINLRIYCVCFVCTYYVTKVRFLQCHATFPRGQWYAIKALHILRRHELLSQKLLESSASIRLHTLCCSSI